MGSLSPIVLFVYNRPEHTKQTIEALQKNYLAEESELFIYSDGPKTEKNQEQVEHVREYISHITGFKKVTVIVRERNMGLAASVISGVTEIVNKYGTVIVLEDDLITAHNFLKYMNAALEKYKDCKKVFSVTGYSLIESGASKISQTYFASITCSWTWATWSDRWSLFEENPSDWTELKTNKKKRKRFDYDGVYRYTDMMIAQMEEKTIDSWAIRWYYTSFKFGGLTLYPNPGLCSNIGFDGSGTHCGDVNIIKELKMTQDVSEFPSEISELSKTRKVIKKNINNNSFGMRLRAHLQSLISKIKRVGNR